MKKIRPSVQRANAIAHARSKRPAPDVTLAFGFTRALACPFASPAMAAMLPRRAVDHGPLPPTGRSPRPGVPGAMKLRTWLLVCALPACAGDLTASDPAP